MLKIVVFDGGWGGEIVANYLSSELETVRVTKVIDWQNAPYEGKDLTQIGQLTEQSLQPYIGAVDLIVLGGYVVSAALEYLRRQYPKQCFVGMGINYYRVKKSRCTLSHVALLGNENLLGELIYKEVRQKLPNLSIICPDCSGWDSLIDAGEMSEDVLRTELQDTFILGSTKQHRRPLTSNATQPLFYLPNKSPTPLQQQIARFLSNTSPQMRAANVNGSESCLSTADAMVDSQYQYNENYEAPLKSQEDFQRFRTDVVLLLDTHFWDIKTELEHLFGYGTRVLDFRQKLLHDVCRELGLRGVDGRPSK